MMGSALVYTRASVDVERLKDMRVVVVTSSAAFFREVEYATHTIGYSVEQWDRFGDFIASFAGTSVEELNRIFLLITDDQKGDLFEESDLEGVRDSLGKCPVWIHLSVFANTREIVRMMKMGLDEYLVHSEARPDLARLIKKSASHFVRRMEIERRSQENSQILRQQIELLTYKESVRKVGDDTSGRKAIENLRTSLSQGAGFGLMLSLTEMIQSMVEDRGDHYALDKEIVHSIRDNASVVRRMLVGLEEYIAVMGNAPIFRMVSIHTIHDSFRFRFSHLKPYLSRKSMTFQIPSGGSRREILVDIDLLFLGLEELLINAWKYSKSGSEVSILTAVRDGYYSIIVKSYPVEYGDFKMNSEMAAELKKPFYRHHPPIEEVIHMEKFVMGLGLSAVEHIVAKHSGIFVIEGGTDYTGAGATPCFLARVMLPLA